MPFWNPSSTVVLCKVPWDSSYDDVVDWTVASRAEYFASVMREDAHVLGSSSYMPLGMAVNVDLPYSEARKYNYCIVTNNRQLDENDEPYTLYYFITQTDYANPSTTVLTCDLDVWTTRFDEFEWVNGYVERSSIGLVNKPLVDAENYPQALNMYCTQPDGVSTGDMYYTFAVDTYSIDRPASADDSDSWVSIVSTASLETDPGTVDNPTLKTAKGGKFDGVFSGCEVYFVKSSQFTQFMQVIAEYPWVSQCIISISSVPSKLMPSDSVELVPIFNGKFNGYRLTDASNNTWDNDSLPPQLGIIDVSKLKSDDRFNASTEPYRHIDKLNAYPYAVIELTSSFSGQSVFLKPECLGSNTTALRYIACAVQPFLSCAVFPERYGSFKEGYYEVTDRGVTRRVPYGELTNCAVWFDEMPTFSIVNNAYIAYMASTAHTRQYQYSDAAWSMSRTRLAAANVYANSVTEANAAYASENDRINLQRYNARLQFINDAANVASGVATGAMSVAASPNRGSALVGAGLNSMGDAAQFMTNALMNQASINTNQGIANRNFATSTGVASNNLALANRVSSGDYDNQVAGIDASYADAALTQPSQSGNTGGAGLLYSNNVYYTVEVRYKTVSDDALIRNGDYFLRFGYAVNRFMDIPRSLVYNSNYSYWKVQQLVFTKASSNDTERNVIKGVFSKGVTVWKDPKSVGKTLPKGNLPDMTKKADYY